MAADAGIGGRRHRLRTSPTALDGRLGSATRASLDQGRERDPGRRSSSSIGGTGRGRIGRLSRRSRHGRGQGHRAGGVPGGVRRSTASIAAGRSAPGCTGSWSTGRSTGRAHARCAGRPRSRRSRTPAARRQAKRERGSAAGRYPRCGRRPRLALPRTPGGGGPPLPARVHAGRDREELELPGERSTRACEGRSTGSVISGGRAMNELRLRERLREAFVPEEREAKERGEGRRRLGRSRHGTPSTSAAPESAGDRSAVGLAGRRHRAEPAGAKVADLVNDLVEPGQENARPELTSLPASGRLWSPPPGALNCLNRTERSTAGRLPRRGMVAQRPVRRRHPRPPAHRRGPGRTVRWSLAARRP